MSEKKNADMPKNVAAVAGLSPVKRKLFPKRRKRAKESKVTVAIFFRIFSEDDARRHSLIPHTQKMMLLIMMREGDCMNFWEISLNPHIMSTA